MDAFRGYETKCISVAAGGVSLSLLVPSDCDALIDSPAVAERFDDDEYIPYWAQLWPSSIHLAEIVGRWTPSEPEPFTVLELGCGVGLVSLTLAARGFRVTASDYDEDALAFVRENARRNRLPPPKTEFVDWRKTYERLRFDRIVAADVLYETRSLRPVAEFVGTHLKPNGFALVVDPRRATADGFAAVARQCGLGVETTLVNADAKGGRDLPAARVFVLRKRGDSHGEH